MRRKTSDEIEERVRERTAELRGENAELRLAIAQLRTGEESLRETEQRLELALLSSQQAPWEWNLQTGRAVWSDRAVETFGYSPGEIEATLQNWKKHVHPDDWQELSEVLNAHVDGHSPYFEWEYRIRCKSGDTKWLFSRGKVVEFDAHNKPLRMIGTSLDITVRKKAEIALRESEQRLELALQGAELGLWDWDLQTGRAVWSDRAVETYGYPAGEIEPTVQNWKRHVHPDDWPMVSDALNAHLEGRSPHFEVDYRIRCKTDELKWALTRGKVVESDVQGKPLRMTGITQDITARRKVEEDLAAERERLAVTLRSIGEGVISTDMEGTVLSINKTAEELTEWTEAEAIGRPLEEVFHIIDEETRKRCENPVRVVLDRGGLVGPPNGRVLIAGSGTERVITDNGSPIRDGAGNILGVVLVFRDITAGRRMLEEVRKSESKYRLLADNTSDCIWLMNLDLECTYVNPAVLPLFGYTPEEAVGTKLSDYCSPEDFEVMVREIQRGLENISPEYGAVFESKALHKDGREVPIEVTGRGVFGPDGKLICLQGATRNITERKRAEQHLRLLSSAVEQSSEGLAVFDLDGNVSYLNDAFARMHGYSPDELLGKNFSILHTTEQMPDVEEAIREIKGAGSFNWESWHVRKDGSVFCTWMQSSRLRNDSGKPVGMIVTTRDITEIKLAEDGLRRSKETIEALLNATTDFAYLLDAEGNYLALNQMVAECEGRSRDELAGQSCLDLLPRHMRADRRRRLEEVVRTGRSIRFEDQTDGRILDSTIYPVFGTGGKVERLAVFSRDITEVRHAEEALRSSEERFRAVFEAACDSIFIKDASLRYTHVNPATGEILGLETSEIVGRGDEQVFGGEVGRHTKEVDLRVLGGESIEEEHARSVRGVRLTFHDVRVPLRDSQGDVIGICGISRNVTERAKLKSVPRITLGGSRSGAMNTTLEKARSAAATDVIVLLGGESGCGKDHLARWIHNRSRRAGNSFFALNCAAISRELAESELFGHEPGAFTGSRGLKKGLLELAEGGTLFLNEIGELPLGLQSKLLAFLDTRSFLRVGGQKAIHVDARLMAASHRNLEAEVDKGRFLPALFYRLAVFNIQMPPLRERTDEIPEIAEQILATLASELPLTEVPKIDPHVTEELTRYHWPGNVRELRNVLERALILGNMRSLNIGSALPDNAGDECSYAVRFDGNRTLGDVTDEVAHLLCKEALRRTGGQRTRASKLLGISRHTLYRYLKRLGIEGGA